MEKGGGIIVVVLIWGGLLYLFVKGPLAVNLGIDNLLGSTLSSFKASLNEQTHIINVFDGAKFFSATVHFNKKIDIFDIKTSPQNPELIFAGSNHGLFVSRDGGLNWYSFSDIKHKINSNSIVYKILFNPAANNQSFVSVFENNKGFIYKSQDNFFALEKILEFDNERVYDFDIYNNHLYLGLSNGQVLLYSLKNNEVQLLTTLNSPITNLKVADGTIYLTLKSGGFWKSENNGQSFEKMKFLDEFRNANKINEFLMASKGLYAATDYGLIRSLNNGETWQVFKSLPVEKPKISALAFKDNPGEIFAASNGKIYRSCDHGSSWQILEPELNGREISVISLNGDRVIIGSKR